MTDHKVAEPSAAYLVQIAPRHVRLFRNGANQAVRIPREFELPGNEALMHREGNRLILELVPDKPKKGTHAALVADQYYLNSMEHVNKQYLEVN